MTTTTAPSQAPTEELIRKAVVMRLHSQAGQVFDTQDELVNAIDRVATEAAYPLIESNAQTLEGGHGVWERVSDPADGVLWQDLRPSEAVDLQKVISAACDRIRERCEVIIVEMLVAAGVAFAAEHPDAPRSDWSPPDAPLLNSLVAQLGAEDIP